ncbi:MAG: MAPEG family protein [Pseudomonadota bacterium]
MINPEMLYPGLALIVWTYVMWLWMYVTRVPAIQKAQIDMEELSRTGAPLELPADVARVADNYNHLHEQPTLFYALICIAALIGAVDSLQVMLAWGYVGMRVIHSLIQATRNVIIVRFGVFVVTSLVLFTLLVRTILLA